MTRVICSILAAGSAALALSSPARADEYRERYEEHAPAPIARRYDDEGMRWRDRDGDRYRGERWRELQRERRQFYSFRHSRAECARFERWYEWRLDRLRFRGW
jgi:hypothetical protein